MWQNKLIWSSHVHGFYCLVYLRNISLCHMTTFKDQQKLYDNVIIKLDKKGTTRRTYGFYHLLLSAYCVSTWGKCCHCVSTHSQTQHNTTSERQREREKARVYMYERESVTKLLKRPQHDSCFKQPQTAGDQIQSWPEKAVIPLWAAIHDTRVSTSVAINVDQLRPKCTALTQIWLL